jgi:hypothetical protein
VQSFNPCGYTVQGSAPTNYGMGGGTNDRMPGFPQHTKRPAAKVAISECAHIDECKDWADKSEALASYAKQAKDDELRNMAERIQARAIRR